MYRYNLQLAVILFPKRPRPMGNRVSMHIINNLFFISSKIFSIPSSIDVFAFHHFLINGFASLRASFCTSSFVCAFSTATILPLDFEYALYDFRNFQYSCRAKRSNMKLTIRSELIILQHKSLKCFATVFSI